MVNSVAACVAAIPVMQQGIIQTRRQRPLEAISPAARAACDTRVETKGTPGPTFIRITPTDGYLSAGTELNSETATIFAEFAGLGPRPFSCNPAQLRRVRDA